MVLTYSDLLTEYKDHTKDDTSENVTRGGRRINRANQLYVNSKPAFWRESTATFTTVALQKNYKLPVSCDKMVSVFVQVGSRSYPVTEIADPEIFDMYSLQLSTIASDYPMYYSVREGEIYFYPLPSSSGLTVTIRFMRKAVNMSKVDYTTGTASITSGSAVVTGAGTTWNTTNLSVGGYFIVDNNYSYEILSIDSTTQITLVKPYAGATASGQSYRIGDASIIPEAFQDVLWLKPAYEYWMKTQDTTTLATYKIDAQEAERALREYSSTRTTETFIAPRKQSGINPNDFPISTP